MNFFRIFGIKPREFSESSFALNFEGARAVKVSFLYKDLLGYYVYYVSYIDEF